MNVKVIVIVSTRKLGYNEQLIINGDRTEEMLIKGH